MIKFRPDVHFFKKLLSKDQHESSHANYAYLDSLIIFWKTAMRGLYSNLGSQ